MATYSLSSRNQLRSPSGAVGEPPDGPGGMATLRDDVDNYLGTGGAEYCAGAAQVTAIPSSRKFVGKLAYRADTDCVYRWVGNGNTAVGANGASNGWQAWSKPPTAFTPTWTGVGMTTSTGFFGISEGLAWFDVVGTVTAIASTTVDVTLGSLPTPIVGMLGSGTGQYLKAGSTGNNNQVDLAVYGIGAAGQNSTSIRVRARVAPTAGAAVTANILGSAITQASGDLMHVQYSGPAAAVL